MKLILPLIFFAASLFCEENKTATDIAKLSEAMGHLIGKNLQSMGLPMDIEALARGMKDACEGKEGPISDDECVESLARLQEETLNLQAEKNLASANEFLARNLKEKGIIGLESGKVQYQIVKNGSGNTVQPYNSPLLRYEGRYLNGESFGASSGDEVISLDETIEGLSKGIIGMREGEVRKIFIHPDLGYGRHGMSTPNALLVFEVELIKADASAEAQAASQAEDAATKIAPTLR